MSQEVVDDAVIDRQEGADPNIRELPEEEFGDEEPKAKAEPEAKPPSVSVEEVVEKLTAKDRKRLEALEAKLQTAEGTNAYLRAELERVSKAGKPSQDRKAADEPGDSLDPEKWVEEFVRDPNKALERRGLKLDREALAKELREEMRQELQAQQDRMKQDLAILKDFEGLGDENSDLFKATLEVIRGVGGDENTLSDPKMLRLAATAAQERLKASKVGRMAREERVAAQGPAGRRSSGDGGGGRGLSPLAEKFARNMGITDMTKLQKEADSIRSARGGR